MYDDAENDVLAMLDITDVILVYVTLLLVDDVDEEELDAKIVIDYIFLDDEVLYLIIDDYVVNDDELELDETDVTLYLLADETDDLDFSDTDDDEDDEHLVEIVVVVVQTDDEIDEDDITQLVLVDEKMLQLVEVEVDEAIVLWDEIELVE